MLVVLNVFQMLRKEGSLDYFSYYSEGVTKNGILG